MAIEEQEFGLSIFLSVSLFLSAKLSEAATSSSLGSSIPSILLVPIFPICESIKAALRFTNEDNQYPKGRDLS
jgi:hypothetical protein